MFDSSLRHLGTPWMESRAAYLHVARSNRTVHRTSIPDSTADRPTSSAVVTERRKAHAISQARCRSTSIDDGIPHRPYVAHESCRAPTPALCLSPPMKAEVLCQSRVRRSVFVLSDVNAALPTSLVRIVTGSCHPSASRAGCSSTVQLHPESYISVPSRARLRVFGEALRSRDLRSPARQSPK